MRVIPPTCAATESTGEGRGVGVPGSAGLQGERPHFQAGQCTCAASLLWYTLATTERRAPASMDRSGSVEKVLTTSRGSCAVVTTSLAAAAVSVRSATTITWGGGWVRERGGGGVCGRGREVGEGLSDGGAQGMGGMGEGEAQGEGRGG